MADGEEGGAAVASTQAAQQVDLETAVETHHDITPEELDRQHLEYLQRAEDIEGVTGKTTPENAVKRLDDLNVQQEFVGTPLEGKIGKETGTIPKAKNSAYAVILKIMGKTGKKKMENMEKQYQADRLALSEQLTLIGTQLGTLREKRYELGEYLSRISVSGLEAENLTVQTRTQIADLEEKLSKGHFKDPKEATKASKTIDTYKSRLDQYKDRLLASASKLRISEREMAHIEIQVKDLESLKADVYAAIETFDLAYTTCPNNTYDRFEEIMTGVAQVQVQVSQTLAGILGHAKKQIKIQDERDQVLRGLDLAVAVKPLDTRYNRTLRQDRSGELSVETQETLERMKKYAPQYNNSTQ